MSPAPSTLPAGWSSILDEVHMRLDHAIALADERIAQMPAAQDESLVTEHQDRVAKWSERLARLSAYLESAEQVVQSVDEMLHQEETVLRNQLAATQTLQQRLADATGGAIG